MQNSFLSIFQVEKRSVAAHKGCLSGKYFSRMLCLEILLVDIYKVMLQNVEIQDIPYYVEKFHAICHHCNNDKQAFHGYLLHPEYLCSYQETMDSSNLQLFFILF